VFLPALSFHEDEDWWPIDAGRFVRASTLFCLSENRGTVNGLGKAHASCRDHTAWPCRRLTCAAGDGECAEELRREEDGAPFVYARVVRVDRTETRRAHAAFLSGPTVGGRRIEIVIQY
jgi:hypothetical protein